MAAVCITPPRRKPPQLPDDPPPLPVIRASGNGYHDAKQQLGALKQSMDLPMFSIAWEQIMDLIGGIKYVGNTSGGRNPNHGKDKAARKETHNDAADDTNASAVANQLSAERHALLGRKVDTTA